MKAFIPREKRGPEYKIQKDLIKFLRTKDWYVFATHGNMYQQGLPDLFATHKWYGYRWIEVKDPKRTGDIFTPAQRKVFPQLVNNGSDVWVLCHATEDEYQKLFDDGNWYKFLQINQIK